MKNFVSVSYVKENLEHLTILDVREEYAQGHIPGAIPVSMEDLAGPVREHGGRHPMPDDLALERLFAAMGLALEDEIVCVDEGDYVFAGRLWWTLKYLGFEQVKVLIGGYGAWVAQKGEVDTKAPQVSPVELKVKPRPELLISMEEVRDQVVDHPRVALVDSRSASRYRGEEEPIDFKAGHIPSALNYPYEEVLGGNPVPDVEALKAHYGKLFDYDEVVVYCGSGMTATVNLLLMEEAGLLPKLYVGSFSDWISYPENPIRTITV